MATAKKKRTTKPATRARRSRFELLASKAPPREKVNVPQLKRLMARYSKVEGEFAELDKRTAALLKERGELAEQVLSTWGKGAFVFEGSHYVPSSREGRIILRKLSVVDGVLS